MIQFVYSLFMKNSPFSLTFFFETFLLPIKIKKRQFFLWKSICVGNLKILIINLNKNYIIKVLFFLNILYKVNHLKFLCLLRFFLLTKPNRA